MLKRLFGRGKRTTGQRATGKGQELSEVIDGLDRRTEMLGKKIANLETELLKCRMVSQKMPADQAKRFTKKAHNLMRQLKQYQTQRERLMNQSFRIEQTNIALNTVRETQTITQALELCAKEIHRQHRHIDVDQLERLQDDMEQAIEMSQEIQETLARPILAFDMPADLDDAELETEFEAITDQLISAQIEQKEKPDAAEAADLPGENSLPPVPSQDPSTEEEAAKTNHDQDEFGLPKLFNKRH